MKKLFKLAGLLLAGAMTFGAAGCGRDQLQTLPQEPGIQGEDPGGLPNDPEIQGGDPAEGNGAQETMKGRSTLLSERKAAAALSDEVRQSEDYLALKQAAERFAAQFAPAALELSSEKNAVVSPISVYMALALASECVSDSARSELETVLGASSDLLRAQTGNLYCGLNSEKLESGLLISKLALSNSIWLQKDLQTKRECLDSLSENFYCSTYSADFKQDNEAANAAIREFVKEQTNGLIDQDFEFSSDTAFALINALYLKDVWNLSDGLFLTEESYLFRQGDGTEKSVNLMEGEYCKGQVVETEEFSHFYTKTQNGYRLKFLLPKAGHSVEEIFTAENIAYVNSIEDYGANRDGYSYFTRCLFPSFDANYNESITGLLDSMGLNDLFLVQYDAALTDEEIYCEKVMHVAKLKADQHGIEGAAVTTLEMDAESVPEKDNEIYEDFLVDGAFGFLVTDPYGTTLFSGIVREI